MTSKEFLATFTQAWNDHDVDKLMEHMDFEKGEEFEVELITIYVNREDGENLWRFEYDGDELDGHNLSGSGVTEEILPY